MPEAREAIKAGKIYADVIQKPDEIGQKTIEVIAQYMSGEDTRGNPDPLCFVYEGQPDE